MQSIPGNVPIIAGVLSNAGWTNSQIAAAIGNMSVESGWNPNSFNTIGTINSTTGYAHYGLLQWDAVRQDNLINWANSQGLDYTQADVQAQFATVEATNPAYGETKAYANFFNNSSDPTSGATSFDKYVEVSEGTTVNQRVNAANAYANDPNNAKYGSGQTLPPELATNYNTTPTGYDAGGAYYTSKDGTTDIQYDNGKWYVYDHATGNPIDTNGNVVSESDPRYNDMMTNGTDQQTVDGPAPTGTTPGGGTPLTPGSGTGSPTTPGSGPGGATPNSQGQQSGGAGCAGGGMSPAQMTAGAGILGNLGGLAQNAAMGGLMGALQGGGLQGIMGGVMGAAGGMLGNALGASLGGAAGGILGQTLGGALGGIVAGGNPLSSLSMGAFGALSQMGSSLIPGLSSVMPAGLASAAIGGLTGVLGGLATNVPPSASIQMGLAGGLSGLISSTVSNMTGNPTLGAVSGAVASGAVNGSISFSQQNGSINLSSYQSVTSIATGINQGSINSNAASAGTVNIGKYAALIQTASAVTSENRNMVGAFSEAMSQAFGNGPNGLGSATRNMQDAMTFSVTTLGQNLNTVSTDLINMGTWDVSVLMRFMQPGNVAYQIMQAGLADTIGLTDALLSLNVAVAGIDNPLFDRIVLAVLASINDAASISQVNTTFNVNNSKIKSLADYCDMSIMMPTSYATIPVKNFRELGVQFAVIGINGVNTVKDIGVAISKVEVSTDLTHISQLSQPLDPVVGQQIMQMYGYGGGSLGEQTMADIIGTPAGYVHNDTIPIISRTNNYIMHHPEASTLANLTVLLNQTVLGKFTDYGSPGDPTSTPPTPDDPGGISVPGVGNFSTMDDAVTAFIPLIEAEHTKLLNTTDPHLKSAIDKLNVAYNASCAQIIRENNNLQIHNIDLFDSSLTTTPASAMMFAQNLDVYGLQTGYGQAGHYLERVASNDLYGDSIKYAMRQARNGAALSKIGVDAEKYKLPRGMYYRTPELFYSKLYTDNLPPRPQNQTSAIYPRTTQEVYINNRDQALADMGLNSTPLLNSQKDEAYYDYLWTDTDQKVLNGIGQSVVKNIISKSISVINSDLILKSVSGAPFKVGTIKQNGLLLDNNEQFIEQMLMLVNRALYGNIVTSKYENPFNTDQMVYGMLEMLSQLNFNNIDNFLKTPTGGLIAPDLLAAIKNFYIAAIAGTIPGIDAAQFSQTVGRRSIFDTTMDRNDPAAWGSVGPDSTPAV